MKGAKNTATKKLDPETRLDITKKGNIEKQRSRVEKSEKNRAVFNGEKNRALFAAKPKSRGHLLT